MDLTACDVTAFRGPVNLSKKYANYVAFLLKN